MSEEKNQPVPMTAREAVKLKDGFRLDLLPVKLRSLKVNQALEVGSQEILDAATARSADDVPALISEVEALRRLSDHHAPPAWRKVSDGLPDRDMDCWVTHSNRCVREACFVAGDFFDPDEFGQPLERVTHHMPRFTPAPPLPDPVGDVPQSEGSDQ